MSASKTRSPELDEIVKSMAPGGNTAREVRGALASSNFYFCNENTLSVNRIDHTHDGKKKAIIIATIIAAACDS